VRKVLAAAAASIVVVAATSRAPVTILPNGWIVAPPAGQVAVTGTMPQGMALSPDRSIIAVVESGNNRPALSLYRASNLARTEIVPLPGAAGRPVWLNDRVVLVAGANADGLLRIDVKAPSVVRIPLPKGSFPIAVAAASNGTRMAVATARDGAVRIGNLSTIGRAAPVALGGFPGTMTFSADNSTIFATVLGANGVVAIDVASRKVKARQSAGLHPSATLVEDGKLYVAETDSDAVGVFDVRTLRAIRTISVADDAPGHELGVSPNALSAAHGTIYVSLGAANSVAEIRNDAPAGRTPAGWYPTDAFAADNRLYILDGKGEGTHPNPEYHMGSDYEYVAMLQTGSLRSYDLSGAASEGNPQGAPFWNAARTSSIVRANGPIRHVFFILKENRTYDQVLGDVPGANGDAALAWFGKKVTPNEHALAMRFGIFDNAYVSGEVSVPGHSWDDTAFANDYIERYWPAEYAGRFDVDDMTHGGGPRLGAGGYIWESAARAHVSFRDYGELSDPASDKTDFPWKADVPSLEGKIDPQYAGWDLDYPDAGRVKEWQREFKTFLSTGTLPQFEFIWLPNDHTSGSKPGSPTPAAYVAMNDYALGQIVESISHSRVWGSSAIFVIEDDAQNGPDHVSDQRTTAFVISPYSRGGVRHEHYSTVSMLRTIELLLGMKPLSTYDAMAVPMYAAFAPVPDARPYTALAPQIDVNQHNATVAYGAAESSRLDFARPDAAPPQQLNAILARNHEYTPLR
jgi:YVTN family beta-propeller protein